MKPGNAGGAKGCRFGITGNGNMARRSAEKAMATRLARFTRRVREVRGEKYTALMGMVWDPEELRESFGRQDGRTAPGVDGVK